MKRKNTLKLHKILNVTNFLMEPWNFHLKKNHFYLIDLLYYDSTKTFKIKKYIFKTGETKKRIFDLRCCALI